MLRQLISWQQPSSELKIKPRIIFPRFPALDAKKHLLPEPPRKADIRATKHPPASMPNNCRFRYDWEAYTPEGLRVAEAYWDSAVAFLAQLLPRRYRKNEQKWRGLNLGTFNGSFQKAWMRRGYRMYGIEIANVIDELHEYGCEGHSDSIYDLHRIPRNSFDFAVLDRVICDKDFYFKIDVAGYRPPRNRLSAFLPGTSRGIFAPMIRTIKSDGVLIGQFYPWYTYRLLHELASYGALTIWPTNAGRLSFQVDRSKPPTRIPDERAARKDARFIFLFRGGVDGERHNVFTNDMIDKEGFLHFAPSVRHARETVTHPASE
jgi:hypothetical protein